VILRVVHFDQLAKLFSKSMFEFVQFYKKIPAINSY